jgi:hypothetical protein
LVPDAELLVSGAYHRAGPDLGLTSPDGRHFIVPGYFSSEHPPALVAPNGMTLSGDMVELLAGSPAPGQYAQAQPGMPADGIGKIEKVVGDVTAIRNGVAVTLHVGDAVFKSDVIQTGAGSSCGISFPDGTALNLVANTRMGLNDYTYNPSSNSNDALFTLVEGTFAFVAGKVAHSGDMKIGTPVATMGIRGTTGVVEEEVATVSATQNGVTYSFSVVADFGTGVAGMYDLIDQAGNVIATVSQTGYVTYLTPQGVGQAPLVSVAPVTNSQFAVEQEILQQLFQTLTPINQQQQQQQTPGNSTPPAPPPNPIIQLLQNGPATYTVATSGTPGTPPPPPTTVTVVVTPPPPPPTTPTATPIVVWTGDSTGNWDVASNWSDDVVPTSFSAVEFLNPVTVTINDTETVNGLDLVAGATLDLVTGGSLTLANSVTGLGTLELDGSGGDPTLAISGTVYLLGPAPTVAAGGEILLNGPAANNLIVGVAGTAATLVNVQDTIIGSGTIGQGDGNLMLVNGVEGTINATGLLVIDTGNQVMNSGLMEATAGGTLQIDDSFNNAAGAVVEAIGAGSTVSISYNGASPNNYGTEEAVAGGTLNLTDNSGGVGNYSGGMIEANSGTVLITGGVDNSGIIEAIGGGTLTVNIDNDNNNNGGVGNFGTIEADDGTISIVATVTDAVVLNSGNGTIEAIDGGTVSISVNVTNEIGGIIEANDAVATVDLNDGYTNYGTIETANGGIVNITGLDGDTVNYGLIEAIDGTINLNITGYGINDGTVEAGAGGTIVWNRIATVENPLGGNHNLVEAIDGGSITYSGSGGNYGTSEASGDGSSITYNLAEGDSTQLNSGNATIEALAGGTITFNGGTVNNGNAFIAANGTGSTIDLNGTTVNGGTIDLAGAASPQSVSEISIPGEFLYQTSMSANGQYVAFDTASNLAGAMAGQGAVELYHNGTITQISNLAPPGGRVGGPISMSADGHYAVFEIDYGPQGQSVGDVFVYNTESQTLTQLVPQLSEPQNGGAYSPMISGNGQYVVMEAPVQGPQYTTEGVIVTDLSGNVLTTIGGDPNYDPGNQQDPYGNPGSVNDPAISANGHYVSFWTTSSEVVIDGTAFNTGNTAGTAQIYVYNTANNTLQMVSVNDQGQEGNNNSGALLLTHDNGAFAASLSANGNYIVFQSSATNLVAGSGSGAETNGVTSVGFDNPSNVYLYDIQTHTITLISAGVNGAAANGTSFMPSISTDGNFIVFQSTATNLVAGDTTDAPETYVYDIQTGTISLASAATDGAAADGESDIFSAISGNGSTVAYGSVADNLVAETTNPGNSNIYVANLAAAPAGTVNVNGEVTIDDGATIVGGTVDVASSSTLLLEEVTVNGSTLTADADDAVVALAGGVTLNYATLETACGGIIGVPSGTNTFFDVTIVGGSVVQTSENGTADLTGTTTLTAGTVTFEGGGTFELGGTGASIIGPSEGRATLVNQTTIEGAGTIGNGDCGNLLSLNNSGTIEASGGTLVINTGTRNSATATNTGTLEANGANAVLEISFTNLLNTCGIIAAFNAPSAAVAEQPSSPSQVDLLDATITNGTLETTNQGTIETITDDGAASTSTFVNVTNEAYVYVTDNTTLVLQDTITNTGGTIALGTGGEATLEISGVTAIDGGTVQLNGGSDSIIAVPGPTSEINAPERGATLSNAATIEGAGDIGSGDASLTLTNQSTGIIDANVSGEQLTINTGSNTITNLGLMEATNGGTLVVDSDLSNANAVTASGGTVTFDDVTVTNTGSIGASTPPEGSAGTVQIDGSTINNAGGTISAAGSGDLVQLSGSTVNGGTLATSEGGMIEFVGTNNVLNGGGTASSSTISVPVHEASTEWHDSGIYVTAGEQITITASGTISIGPSEVDGQNVANLTPAGDPNLVTSEVANNFLENGLVPWSLIGIISGATPVANAANAFEVGNSTTFTASASGELYLNINDNNFTDNSGNWSATVALSSPGMVTNSGFTQVECGANLTLEGVIDNSGTFDVAFGTNSANLVISGGVVLEGSGSVTLEGSTDGIVGATGGGILDNTGNTISGSGDIGLAGNGLLSLVNSGTVEATTGNLVIDTGQTVVNNGTLEANGATLVVDDPVSGSGQVLVASGGTADFAAALGENVTFSGVGTLGLADPTAFNGQITGLNLGDTIDLSNIALSDIGSANIVNGQLVVEETGDGPTLTFNIAGNLTGNQFVVSSDGNHGTDLTLTANNLVVNGGFETGNLNGWTGNGVQLQYDQVVEANAHSGNYSLELGAVNAEYDVSQNIATVTGQTYQVQFWLENPGGTPSNFTASFGGETLLSLVNTNAQGYTEYTYDVTATSSSSELLFVAEQNPSFWYLDDVSVAQVNAPVGDPPITAGATLTVSGASSEVYDFTGATGTLVLDQPGSFTGQIEGFTGTAANAAHSDVIDLAGINYDSGHFSESYNASTGVLAVSDGTDSANLTFDNFSGTLQFASDGNGGTDIFDPPSTGSNGATAPAGHGISFEHDQFNLSENNWTGQNSQNPSTPSGGHQSGSVSIGGISNEHFVFQPAQFTETSLTTNQPSTPTPQSEHAGDHANTQLAALVHEAVFQPAFDAVHDDAAAATAQFHQIVASAGHLH